MRPVRSKERREPYGILRANPQAWQTTTEAYMGGRKLTVVECHTTPSPLSTLKGDSFSLSPYPEPEGLGVQGMYRGLYSSPEVNPTLTMKTVTGVYKCLFVVEDNETGRLGHTDPEFRYRGYQDRRHEGLDNFLSEVNEYMADIYGNVAGNHYVVDSAKVQEEGSIDMIVDFVVTAVVAGDSQADAFIGDDYPHDLINALVEHWEDGEWEGVVGFDANHIHDGPETTYDTGWEA